MQHLYLDNQTITRPCAEALAVMQAYFTDKWGHPMAPHSFGQSLLPDMERAYSSLYKLFGATNEDTIIFTSSGAEATNHIIQSVYRDVTISTGRNQFITSNTESAPSIMGMSLLESLGCSVKMAATNEEGLVSVESISDNISPRTAMLSLSWANPLTGVLNPIEEIAHICQERGILFHLDASHVITCMPLDLEEILADFVSIDGSLIHAPQGTGALFMRKEKTLSPLIAGGHEQASLRAGGLNIPALMALGVACEEAVKYRDLMCTEINRLRKKLEEGLLKSLKNVNIFFDDSMRLPQITALGFPGLSNDALLFALSRKGLFASFGGNHLQTISGVLKASAADAMAANSAISFALSRYTTEEEVDQAVAIIFDAVLNLRKISEGIFMESPK